MIAVVQRVSRAEVRVPDQSYRAAIDLGLMVLLGVETGDTRKNVDWMAWKIANLRIFADDDGNMNRSVIDVGGSVLVVSQFTLAGDCRKGNRPSFIRAARPAEANELYEYFVDRIRDTEGVPAATGVFQAMMEVELVNQGPVTLIVEQSPGSK
ncbi:MAG: D-aminoacyl-tRNA deacylase [Planctomycetota bacterium]